MKNLKVNFYRNGTKFMEWDLTDDAYSYVEYEYEKKTGKEPKEFDVFEIVFSEPYGGSKLEQSLEDDELQNLLNFVAAFGVEILETLLEDGASIDDFIDDDNCSRVFVGSPSDILRDWFSGDINGELLHYIDFERWAADNYENCVYLGNKEYAVKIQG